MSENQYRMLNQKNQYMLFMNIAGFFTIFCLSFLIDGFGVLFLGVALELYNILDILFFRFLPDTMAELISGRLSKEQYKNAYKCRRVLFFYSLILGLLCFLGILFFSHIFAANWLKLPELRLVLMVMSFLVLIQSVLTFLQGNFLGMGTAGPLVLSEGMKRVTGLFTACIFGTMLYHYGEKVSKLLQNERFSGMYGAMGVLIGLGISALLGLLLIAIVYFGAGRRFVDASKTGLKQEDQAFDLVKQMIRLKAPLGSEAFLLHYPLLLGLLLVILQKPSEEQLEFLGTYYGRYGMLLFCVTAGLLCIFLKRIGTIEKLQRAQDYKLAGNVMKRGFKLLWALGLWMGMIFLVFRDSFMAMLSLSAGVEEAVSKWSYTALCFFPLTFALDVYITRACRFYKKGRISLTALFLSNTGFLLCMLAASAWFSEQILVFMPWGLFLTSLGYLCFMIPKCFTIYQERLSFGRVLLYPLLGAGLIGLIFFVIKFVLQMKASVLFLFISLPISFVFYFIYLLSGKYIKKSDFRSS